MELAKNIGRAVTILCATGGAESTIVYLSEEEKVAQDARRLVREKCGKAHLITADLRSRQACKNVVEKAMQPMGTFNILVQNHAFQVMQERIGDFLELVDRPLPLFFPTHLVPNTKYWAVMSLLIIETCHREQWIKTFDTNVHPFFFLSKYSLPHMTRGDTIITSASVNPYVGRLDLLDSTSKKAFTRALSNQKVSDGIRINALYPGPIWTPLVPATMNSKAQDQFTSPIGRSGLPSEVATCFVFLAGPDDSFISGQILHPNGGTIGGS